MKRIVLVLLALLSLPVLLHIYQPAMRLGAGAYALGWIGQKISPIILFGALIYLVVKEWNK
jgi:hypothetical protein